jgi:hypothetical protein
VCLVQEIRDHGPRTDSLNAFTTRATILAFGYSLSARLRVAEEGTASHLFRPMYAGANMGHPSREKDFVVGSNRDAAMDLGRGRFHFCSSFVL